MNGIVLDLLIGFSPTVVTLLRRPSQRTLLVLLNLALMIAWFVKKSAMPPGPSTLGTGLVLIWSVLLVWSIVAKKAQMGQLTN